MLDSLIVNQLRSGCVIPAHPLALQSDNRIDERHQRALTRYYLAAGAGGLAVGVHTTQFAIHQPVTGLYRPVLELAIETARQFTIHRSCPVKDCSMPSTLICLRSPTLRRARQGSGTYTLA